MPVRRIRPHSQRAAPTPTPDPPILHLVCGLPGAGKTTFARALSAETGAVRFCPDEWLHARGHDGYDAHAREEVEAEQWAAARQLLSAGRDVILENGFWSRAERDRYRSEARSLGAQVQLRYLHAPLESLRRRVMARNHRADSPFLVDPDDLDGWYAAFEPPDPDELAG